MLLSEAIKPYGTAHNRSTREHIVVTVTAIYDRGSSHSGFTVYHQDPLDITPAKVLYPAFTLLEVEAYLKQSGHTPPTHMLDMDAWTAT